MKRWGVSVCVLLAFALVVSVPFSAQAFTYSKTYYDPLTNGELVQEGVGSPGTTNDVYTLGATFSSGFNLKVVQIDVDTEANGGTVTVTYTFPCQAGNGNASTDAECHALNQLPDQSCEDDNPNIDCITTFLGNDAPDTAPADSENYRFRMIPSLWPDPGAGPPSVLVVEITPGILFPNTNVQVTLGPGVAVSPSSINFLTLPNAKQIAFTITQVNAVVDLTQSWGFYAFANAEEDGPGEDNFRGDVIVEIPPPGLRCVSKTFNKTTLEVPPGAGVVKATVSVKNTGEQALTDLVITDVMSDAAKMTIVPGTSTLLGGDPVEGPPGTWTFPPQFLAAGDTLTFSYDVRITGMLDTDTLCNQITAASDEFDLSSDGPTCRACVTATTKPPGVPALGTIGFAVALAMVTMGGVMLYRQRRNRA